MKRQLPSIYELKSLSSDSIFSIAKIEWWLLKYQDDYKKIEDEDSKRFWHLIEGEWLRLPDYFDARTPKERFLKIYETLDKISVLHKKESYFKKEMAIYKEIKYEPQKVSEWLTKNEKLGVEYKWFNFDYLEYGETYDENHLKVFFLEDDDLEEKVDREDFIHTIEFVETFNELYR